jgi:hypothetical protein
MKIQIEEKKEEGATSSKALSDEHLSTVLFGQEPIFLF